MLERWAGREAIRPRGQSDPTGRREGKEVGRWPEGPQGAKVCWRSAGGSPLSVSGEGVLTQHACRPCLSQSLAHTAGGRHGLSTDIRVGVTGSSWGPPQAAGGL